MISKSIFTHGAAAASAGYDAAPALVALPVLRLALLAAIQHHRAARAHLHLHFRRTLRAASPASILVLFNANELLSGGNFLATDKAPFSAWKLINK
jgi:hypothetical protein